MITINYLAVIAAAIAAVGVGVLWYGPLFGKEWMKLMGFTPESMKAMKISPKMSMILTSLCTVLMVYVLAHFVKMLNVMDALSSLALAFWIWLGFIVTTMANQVLFEDKPWKLYLLNISHYFVVLLVAAMILALWQ
jgi:hypothetical protein